jgi:hypothetical protein
LRGGKKPDVIAGIGNKGAECSKLAFPEEIVTTIRHPSNGGKQDFIAGMNRLIK